MKKLRKTINNLPTKDSCGFDGISTKLLKVIEPVILKKFYTLVYSLIN